MYSMYLITEISKKFQVTCKKCCDRGYISNECHSCGGKGIHNKTFKIWTVKDRLIEIDKIDRCEGNSFYKGTQVTYKDELRYWTDLSCFYNEHDKMVHFTEKDADRECKQRNIKKYGEDFYKQYIKDNNSIIKTNKLGLPVISGNGKTMREIYNEDYR